MVTKKEIVDYYDFSTLDYQLYSGSRTNISMHYGLWDETTKNHKQALLNENRILADIAQIKSPDKVIDIGCGYGLSSIWLAQNLGCHVTGITFSKKQVEFAKKLAKSRGVAHLTKFIVGDFHSMRFPDKSFTVAFVIESISHSKEKAKAVLEIYRVLKNNGRCVIADGFFHKDPTKLTEREQDIAAKCFKGVYVPPVARKEIFERYIKKSGFKNVKFYDKTSNILPTARYVHRFGLLLYPLSRLFEWLGIKALKTSHMEAFINQYYAFNECIGIYGIFYGKK